MKRKFFLVSPLGAEEDVLQELLECSPFLVGLDGWPLAKAVDQVQVVKGGIEFEADLATGLQLNYWLKLPVRILLRLFEFKCRDRRELWSQLDKGAWKEWLSGVPKSIKVESSASKVWHESGVETQVQEFLQKKFTTSSPSTLYLRGLENRWTVSLDLCGDPLFKRGWSPLKGTAPLRENLAMLGLRALIKDQEQSLQEITLADPFLGSGTILSEGFHFFDLQNQRNFSFEQEPFCPKLLKDKKLLSNYRLKNPTSFKNYFGTEIDAKTFSTAESNLADLPHLNIYKSSFEDARPEGRVWILTNPPYEKRVRVKAQGQDWLSYILDHWKPEKMGFYYPKDKLQELEWPKNYQVESRTVIAHGGLSVQLTILVR